METPSLPEAFIITYILWDIVKELIFEKNKDLKSNTSSTVENTFAIRELRTELHLLASLPKDVNVAHSKIRLLEEKLNFLGKNPINQ